ncbi:MAG: HD domain-containing protein [Alphaproteobacteria bacterium]|nr:HD domain-containing protein [Alphaproteobacteria bacterium]
MHTNTWPDNFDFATDETCQNIFRPFIEEQLKSLAAYDAQRPENHTYIFHEHAARVAENTYRTCIAMGLREKIANNMRWAVLPHDIGKQKLPVDIWDQEEKPTGDVKAYRRTHTTLGADIAKERFSALNHPFKDLMIDIMLHHHEQMDGQGTLGLTAEHLSAPVRLAAIVEAYDGYRIWRPHFEGRDISPPGVLKRMREEKGAQIYDMDLFEAFAKMKMDDYKQGRLLQSH